MRAGSQTDVIILSFSIEPTRYQYSVVSRIYRGSIGLRLGARGAISLLRGVAFRLIGLKIGAGRADRPSFFSIRKVVSPFTDCLDRDMENGPVLQEIYCSLTFELVSHQSSRCG